MLSSVVNSAAVKFFTRDKKIIKIIRTKETPESIYNVKKKNLIWIAASQPVTAQLKQQPRGI